MSQKLPALNSSPLLIGLLIVTVGLVIVGISPVVGQAGSTTGSAQVPAHRAEAGAAPQPSLDSGSAVAQANDTAVVKYKNGSERTIVADSPRSDAENGRSVSGDPGTGRHVQTASEKR